MLWGLISRWMIPRLCAWPVSYTHLDAYKRQPIASPGRQRSYAKNKILYAQGEATDCFYYIVSGRIKTFISSTAGNERLLRCV